MAQQLFAALIHSTAPVLFDKAYHAALTAQVHFQTLSIPLTDALLITIFNGGIERLGKLINLTSASRLPKLQLELAINLESPIFIHRAL
jgi:hypothetical protein